MKNKTILLAAIVLSFVSLAFAQTSTPDAIVRSLYAAHRTKAGEPFFQTKSRARVDKYFTKSLADLIWKDATGTPQGEVGNLDFDPLYNAQDDRITQLRFGKPEYGEGNLSVADVAVTFKNFGKKETVLFRLEKVGKAWKIDNISYPSINSSLKEILSQQSFDQ